MINRVVLVGRITKDIDLRRTQSGLAVASFTLAVNRRVSSNTQERQADFISCVAWRSSAEFLSNYAKKGSLLGVEGRIQTRNYDGPDGKRVYVTEVVCDSVQLLESRNSTNRQQDYNQMQPVDNSFDSDNGFNDFTDDINLDISSDDLPF